MKRIFGPLVVVVLLVIGTGAVDAQDMVGDVVADPAAPVSNHVTTITGTYDNLVFTDAPSETNAENLVVNDLNLRISETASGFISGTFWGNYFEESSWYSEETGHLPTILPTDAHNTVEVIRIPAGALTGNFSLTVTAASIVDNAVPGFDGGANNQDFALYVRNATQ